MKKILIQNLYKCHYEIIETIIVKHKDIFNISEETQIYLHIITNSSFVNYIKSKYPNIIFNNIKDYDYYVNCTVYEKDFKKINKNDKNKLYISHRATKELDNYANIYCLTPLAKRYIYCDILPFCDTKKIKTRIPNYIIQGNLNQRRRNLNLLIQILSHKYEHSFKIKMIGRGKLPNELIKFKDKIILKNNLNFIDYHKEFLDGYCILPLITKKSHPKYYSTTLTSTINYAKAYNLKCLIDKDLQNIYNLNNVEIFTDNIVNSFKNTLKDFYS